LRRRTDDYSLALRREIVSTFSTRDPNEPTLVMAISRWIIPIDGEIGRWQALQLRT
jgi:hypothetical protein